MVESTYTPVIAFTRLVFRGLGIRFTVSGEEHVPQTGGAVMAINHVGYLDFTFAGLAARKHGRLVRFMAKKEVFDHKVSGPLMRGMKHIPVDRYGVGGDSYDLAVKALRAGEIVGVFPEATISTSYELKDFKTGAARMALEADVPLLPAVVWGSQRIMTKGRKRDLTRGTPLRIVVGAPFTPEPGADPLGVTAELKARMSVLLEEAISTYPGEPRTPEDTWWIPARLGGTAPTLEQAAARAAEVQAERIARRAAQGPGTTDRATETADMALLKRSPKAVPATGKAGSAKGPAGKRGPAGKNDPAGKKPKRPRGARLKQIKTAFAVTRANDPKVLPIVLAAFFSPFLLLLAIGFVVGHPVYLGIIGFMLALLLTAFVFGRRVQATAYSQVEGQIGAAAAVLTNMRGDWRVTPAVGFTREQDLVHRVVGRPGIVLVAEGAASRSRGLVTTEKRKLARFVGDTPVYDVLVGDGEGQVTLRGLEKHFLKLPRNIKGKQVNDLDRRLKAIGGATMPVPKGPVPRGKVPRR